MKLLLKFITICFVMLFSTGVYAEGDVVKEEVIIETPSAEESIKTPPGEEISVVEELTDKEIKDRATFDAALTGQFAMTPDEFKEFQDKLELYQKLQNKPRTTLIPVLRSVNIDSKTNKPVVLNMETGHVSALTFSDIHGNPWPVETIITGNPQAFAPLKTGDNKNIIAVSSLERYIESNLIVTLIGLPAPIVLTLRSGEKTIDYQLDLKIMERGPNSVYEKIEERSYLSTTGDSVILKFLDGTPPAEAFEIKTSHHDVEIWSFNKQFYVRSKMILLAPAYIGKTKNISGVYVFTISEIPVLSFLNKGEIVSVNTIGG